MSNGYGILYSGNRRYHTMGWDAKMPESISDLPLAEEIYRLELMAHFKNTASHDWFQKCYKKLEKCRSVNGTYVFSKTSIPENEGYWVISSLVI